MIILGFDTSCDDTCVATVEADKRRLQRGFKRMKFEVLSNMISSQVKLHAKYGGVYPALAKREHIKNLPTVFKQATKKIKLSEIDLIGLTVGPGLEPCLWQGINFAKNLAQKLNLPIVPINHIEAHILANWLPPVSENSKFQIPGLSCFAKQSEQVKSKNIFPAICLVISGGHTQLILMKGIGKYKILGETRDDAAGECFDKAARILGVGYPGGPAIAKIAKGFVRGRASVNLPRPMIYQKNYDFSFSGLKTAVLYEVKSGKRKVKNEKYIQAMSAEIQQAIIDVLIHKTIKAAKNFNTKSIILGGGVAANDELRKQFMSNVKCQMSNVKFFVPPKNLCTDNAAMIAITAYFNQKKATKDWQKIKADANLKI